MPHFKLKRDRTNEDDTFLFTNMQGRRGRITATFTTNCYLREGANRDKLGERLSKSAGCSTDQRRMLQDLVGFPTKSWRHRISKGKESNKCDLCRLRRYG